MIRRLVFNREIQDSDKRLDENILFTFMGQCQATKRCKRIFFKNSSFENIFFRVKTVQL